MSNINTILKLNGLTCLFFGALFVFIPQYIITFLSSTNPAPTVVLLSMGVVLNLYGLLLLWVGNQENPNNTLIKFIAVGDFLWVLMTAGLIISKTWITSTNGTTTAGLIAILVGWFGVQQWQRAKNQH